MAWLRADPPAWPFSLSAVHKLSLFQHPVTLLALLPSRALGAVLLLLLLQSHSDLPRGNVEATEVDHKGQRTIGCQYSPTN